MNLVKRLGITLAVVISLFLIFSQTAYASTDAGALVQTARAYYLAVGTFSMIIQVLIGGFVGVVAIAGVYRARVRHFLGNLFKKRKAGAEGEKIEDVEENE
jgi:hypothetical protein